MITYERIKELRSARQVLAPPAPEVIEELLNDLEKANEAIYCLGDEWICIFTTDKPTPNVPLLTYARFYDEDLEKFGEAEYNVGMYDAEKDEIISMETGEVTPCVYYKYLDPSKEMEEVK